MEGEVKFYNVKKGFGFIVGDDNKEYFTHYTMLEDGLKLYEGTLVEFTHVHTKKGPQAQNVRGLN